MNRPLNSPANRFGGSLDNKRRPRLTGFARTVRGLRPEAPCHTQHMSEPALCLASLGHSRGYPSLYRHFLCFCSSLRLRHVLPKATAKLPECCRFSSIASADYDTVNLHDLSILVRIPLRHKSGPIPFKFDIIGNSSLSPSRATTDVNGNEAVWWNANNAFGGTPSVISGLRPFAYAEAHQASCPQGGTTNVYADFIFTDSLGTPHLFDPVNGFVDLVGCYRSTATATSYDGSGYTLSVTVTPHTGQTGCNSLAFDLYDLNYARICGGAGCLRRKTFGDPENPGVKPVRP